MSGSRGGEPCQSTVAFTALDCQPPKVKAAGCGRDRGRRKTVASHGLILCQ